MIITCTKENWKKKNQKKSLCYFYTGASLHKRRVRKVKNSQAAKKIFMRSYHKERLFVKYIFKRPIKAKWMASFKSYTLLFFPAVISICIVREITPFHSGNWTQSRSIVLNGPRFRCTAILPIITDTLEALIPRPTLCSGKWSPLHCSFTWEFIIERVLRNPKEVVRYYYYSSLFGKKIWMRKLVKVCACELLCYSKISFRTSIFSTVNKI